jgi:hypothetical protein
MYRVLSELRGGALERRIARNFRIIYRDELLHGPAQIHAIERLAGGEDDWKTAIEIVRKVGRQRLRMRNEMFSFPVDIAQLDEMAAPAAAAWPGPTPP